MQWKLRSLSLFLFLALGASVGARAQGAREGLHWPAITAQTKPWTRWWWMGSAVDKANLTWNLEKYQAAGLGGLELTPIYGVKGYESHFIDYLSPAWMDMLGYTLKEAKRLGLGLDMSTGTGWPFGGGPLIDSTYACKEVFSRVWVVKGGQRLSDTVRMVQEPLAHTEGRQVKIDALVEPVFANKELQALALFQVRFARMLPLQALMAYSGSGEVVDLTGRVDGAGRLDWVAPAGGDWTVYGIFQGWHGKMVERAAPGAEGNVIDHFSAAALKKYLSRFDTAFAGRGLSSKGLSTELSSLRCFFNDSYEVDDARGQANWTPGFFASFRQRRGYDLRLHLPALFGKDTKENNARVLCDYRETISDLLLDEFTRPWADWAHSKGAVIRNQAHGSPANILDLYAASDIPETEGGEVLRYKFATSVAHVTGKPLVSAETVTWLGEHFLASYADVKKALDGYFLGGVNHIFYHGTAYTPKDDPWPGWLFYASVHFTPNDPAWGDVEVLNNYVARCQSFLQQGAPDNDVLLYYPMYDSWSEGGGSADPGKALLKHYDRMDPEFSGTGFKACAEELLRKGYAFDYISDKQLRGGGVAGAATRRYKAIVIPDCRYIPPETMERLLSLADSGGTILIYKSLPADVPGYNDVSARQAALRQGLSRLTFVAAGSGGIQQAVVGKGHFLMGAGLSSLLDLARIRRERMVDDSLDVVRRQYGEGHVYLIVNHGSTLYTGYVSVADSFGGAAIYDPMTGVSGVARVKGAAVYIELSPGESCIVQTSVRAMQGAGFPYYTAAGSALELKGDWTVEFVSGGPVLPAPGTQLGAWNGLAGDGMAAFSGTASYTIGFDRPVGGTSPARAEGGAVVERAAGGVAAWRLDLGKVRQTAEVSLNGKKMGTLIGPDYRVILPAADMRDKNILEVRVSGGMLNRIQDMERRGVVYKKFYNTNFPAHERGDRGADGLFDATKLAPEEAGLIGPVLLQPLKRVRP
jgi:hypothetical protein